MYAHLTADLYLELIPLPPPGPQADAVAPQTHWLIILDRSTSLHWALYQLGEDLIERVNSLPAGDTVSFGWFSSPGQYRFVTKGYALNGADSRHALGKLIRQNVASIGTTCFSEVLADAYTVVEELAPLGGNFGLMFLTDGHPVVPDVLAERRRTLDALDRLGGKLASTVLIGYGDYYNKELMAQMAERVGGSLVHASDLPYLKDAIHTYTRHAPRGVARYPFAVPGLQAQGEALFLVGQHDITLCLPNDFNEIWLPADGLCDLYRIVRSERRPSDDEVALERMPSGAYAAAAILSQQGRADQGLDILSALGDTYLTQKLTNAFTVAEYGAAETEIKAAAVQPNRRFTNGRERGYRADPHAPCVLDVLERLAEDEQAGFHPYHPTFSYKRIGRPTSYKGNPPKFHANLGTKAAFGDLVWNESKLNLSVLARISGHVDLDPNEATTYGLTAHFPTFRYKSYAVIAGGLLNTPVLPVSVGRDTFEWLQSIHLIAPGHHWVSGAIYDLHLTGLPLVNRARVEASTSAIALAELAWSEQTLKAYQKFVNWEIKRLDPEGVTVPSPYTELQQAFLKSQGLKPDGSYAPETFKEPATDVISVPEFEIKLTGLSSLPGVEEVKKAMASGKDLTARQTLLAEAIEYYETSSPTLATERLAYLRTVVGEMRRQLRGVRASIAARKLGLVLGKRWLFPTREQVSFTHHGQEYTFALRWVEEPI